MTSRRWFAVGAGLTLTLATILSHFAASAPDALEHSLATTRPAADGGILDGAEGEERGLFPDYGTPGIDAPFASGAVAGAIGVVAVFGLLVAAGWLLRRRPAPGAGVSPGEDESPHG
jgi:hypothetical protein